MSSFDVVDGQRPIQYARSPSPVQRITYEPSDGDIRTPKRKTRAARSSMQSNHRNKGRVTQGVHPHNTEGHSTTSIEGNLPSKIDPLSKVESGANSYGGIEGPMFDEIEGYHEFLDSIRWDDTIITPVTTSNKIFVVQGWNARKRETTPFSYHLSRTRAGSSVSIMCECPVWKIGHPCFHEMYLHDCGEEQYPISSSTDDHKSPCLVSRTETAIDNTFHNIFSAPRLDVLFHTIKSRAIVEHIGQDNGDGSWSCHKDIRAISCQHIEVARQYLKSCTAGEVSESSPDDGAIKYNHEANQRATVPAPEAVSYLPVNPPPWARIESDGQAPVIPTIISGPDLIAIDVTSTCCCKSDRVYFTAEDPITTMPCVIYSITEAWSSRIETQRCKACIHRRIGPDCGVLGLFNFNNRLLFTHELMNDYTSAFTTSETPFAAFVQGIRRRYIGRQSSHDFVTEKVFIAAWFSFVTLMKLDNDMVCSLCGPTPKVTIWDGVTLAFNRRHLLTTLRPPTVVDASAPVRDKMRPSADVRLIADRDLRRTLRHVLDGPPLLLPNLAELRTAVGDNSDIGKNAVRQRAIAMTSRLDNIPAVVEGLNVLNAGLGSLFERHFGMSAISDRKSPLGVYVKLFRQIGAEESGLQLINISTLSSLKFFFNNPSQVTASNIVLIPVLHQVVEHELSDAGGGSVSAETLEVCRWLFTRAYTIFGGLCKYGRPADQDSEMLSDDGLWKQTGVFYSLPQVRSRPSYPAFPNDSGRDNPKAEMRGEGCNKFYSRYGENRLTGGIMGVWCTHSICYGFHCIPTAEGRNDVFSAIYTRWQTAPRMVVYDFACALQPYCMAREPEFFANTVFVIDSFHSSGHTKCGHATFLDTYCTTNPLLLSVNSSAAESGNGGIGRIRKSVSYMSQGRAIIYTKVFLSIWNRARIRASGLKG